MVILEPIHFSLHTRWSRQNVQAVVTRRRFIFSEATDGSDKGIHLTC